MTVLLIGASGHLGSHLARVLLADGYRVRALVRPSSDCRGLAGLDLELVTGDLLDRASLGRAMHGCRAAFHLAAPTSLTPGLSRTVVEGTRNVLDEAARAGLERLVYTSSIVTLGYAHRPEMLDESASELTPASEYHVGKWQAEQLVLAFVKQTGFPAVVVNPATVVGPLDYRVTPSNAPIQRCLERGLPYTFDSGVTVVHAEDAARGHVLALERGAAGERYILGGDCVTIADYFRLLCELCCQPLPRWHLPRWALLASGAGFSLARLLTRRQVPFTLGQARHLVGRYGWYSSQKAVRELGYTWRPVREAAGSYIDWARDSRGSVPSLHRAA
jgi:dihydroflavonol-4-reductase